MKNPDLLYWLFLAGYALSIVLIHCYLMKNHRLKKAVANNWHDAEDNLVRYLVSSLKKNDKINPYETMEYKNLIRERQKSWIAYVENNHFFLRKNDLSALLNEVKDDEVLKQRVLKLMSLA